MFRTQRTAGTARSSSAVAIAAALCALAFAGAGAASVATVAASAGDRAGYVVSATDGDGSISWDSAPESPSDSISWD
ncbi:MULTISPECIES: hypothetical protein [unclassified Streptomyces]|uniref:hypothetical protein n=1 Tax=unclassified Streptomyces TaxID=2593676 RepID=UPI0037004430